MFTIHGSYGFLHFYTIIYTIILSSLNFYTIILSYIKLKEYII